MSANVPKPNTLEYLMKRAGFDRVGLAEALDMSLHRIQDWLSGRAKGMHPKSRIALAKALGVDESELDREYFLQDEPPSTEINVRAFANGLVMQDCKNVIRDESISERILGAHSLPSFVECVEASATFVPTDLEAKDVPIVRDLNYNHFFQAGALISVNSTESNQPHMLGYYRSPLPGSPQHIHTQGLAVLWGASFPYNLSRLSPSFMDRWIGEVRRSPVRAQNQFTAERSSILADLLYYKINLSKLPTEITPFAVITNDQRNRESGAGRVYTQYVFRMHLSVQESQKGIAKEFQRRAPAVRLCFLPQAPMTAQELKQLFCDRSSGKRNLMDILAWRAMFTKQRRIGIELAALRRGFDLLPKRSKKRTTGR